MQYIEQGAYITIWLIRFNTDTSGISRCGRGDEYTAVYII